jgi:heme/copper-type cytochrome/quinol oxidase subunit 2
VTSYRAHGKWGDFIIALLPVSWCINILSNSNFILRLLEWQTESNLLTIRIRGRQWYWVYKIEIQALFDIGNVAKNIGHNYWTVFHNSNNLHIDTYLNILRAKWNDDFYSNYLNNTLQFDGDDTLLHLWQFSNSYKRTYNTSTSKQFNDGAVMSDFKYLYRFRVRNFEDFDRFIALGNHILLTGIFRDYEIGDLFDDLSIFADFYLPGPEAQRTNFDAPQPYWEIYFPDWEAYTRSFNFDTMTPIRLFSFFPVNTVVDYTYHCNPLFLDEDTVFSLKPYKQLWPTKELSPDDTKYFFFGFNYLDSSYDLFWSFLEDPLLDYSLNWLYSDLLNETSFDDYSSHTVDNNIILTQLSSNKVAFNLDNSVILNDFYLNESSANVRTNIFSKFEPIKIYWHNNTLTSIFEAFNNNLVTEHDMSENTYLVIIQKRIDNRETTVKKAVYNPQTPSLDYVPDDIKRRIDVALTYSWFQDYSFFEIFDNDVIVYKEDIKDENGKVVLRITRFFEIGWKDHMPLHGGNMDIIRETLIEKLNYARPIEAAQWAEAVKAGKDPLKEVKFLFTQEPDFYDVTARRLIRTRYIKKTQQPNLYARRLLRTRRLLVLPTNINITLITNSFDVVHSWYIPGLGIKMDCIPGRSTHHTIHIDHAGFYYGQCAEICGRFHHHMPIRICALPFEHFILWWYHYGLPYFLAGEGEKRETFVKSSIRSLSW